MNLSFNTKMPTEKLLGGYYVVEAVSDQTFILLGAKDDMEPEFRWSSGSGDHHYEYAGEKQYIPWLFVECQETGEKAVLSLNEEFKQVPFPDEIPQEWGTPGRKFKLKKEGGIVWLS